MAAQENMLLVATRQLTNATVLGEPLDVVSIS
jgi:hypothetical protein